MMALVTSARNGILGFRRNEGGELDACDGYASAATKMNCMRVMSRPTHHINVTSLL